MSDLNWSRLRDQCLVGVAAILFLYALSRIASHFIHAIVLVLLAIVVAAALEPVLMRLEKVMPRMVAALATYLFAAVLVGAGVFFFLGPLVGQAHSLGLKLPDYFDHLVSGVNAVASQYGVALPAPSQQRANLLVSIQAQFKQLLFQAIGYLALLAGVLADVALVLLLAFWFMVDGRRIRAAVARLVAVKHRERVQFVEETLSTVLGGYIRGQLTMAAIIGATVGIGCWLLGVQYPIVIGLLAFLFELVPMAGPVLAAMPAILISAFQPFPLVLYVLLFFVAVQFLESNVLGPRITGGAVGLHPVAAILGLVGGLEAGGIVGALFALPALSIASILASASLKAWRGEPVVVQRKGMTFRMPNLRRPRRKEPVV